MADSDETQGLVNESSLEDISDAIRTKLETEDTYYPSEMAAAILSIPTGGPYLDKVNPTGSGHLYIVDSSSTIVDNNYYNVVFGQGQKISFTSYDNGNLIFGTYNTLSDASGNNYQSLLGGSGNTGENLHYATILGANNNIKNCYSSLIIGENNKTFEGATQYIYQSFILGADNQFKSDAVREYSIIGGSSNKISGEVHASLLMGWNNTYNSSAIGTSIFSGSSNEYNGSVYESMISGTSNKVNGADNDIICGISNTATNVSDSLIVGTNNTASNLNDGIICGNNNTNTDGDIYINNQLICGLWNKPTAGDLLEVGYGNSNTERKNVFSVNSSGNATISNSLTIGSTSLSEAQLQALLALL